MPQKTGLNASSSHAILFKPTSCFKARSKNVSFAATAIRCDQTMFLSSNEGSPRCIQDQIDGNVRYPPIIFFQIVHYSNSLKRVVYTWRMNTYNTTKRMNSRLWWWWEGEWSIGTYKREACERVRLLQKWKLKNSN